MLEATDMRQNIPNRDRGAAGGADAPRTSPHGMPLEGQTLPGRRDRLQPAANQVDLPDNRLRYSVTGRRTMPGTFAEMRLFFTEMRLFLASVFAPLFVLGAAALTVVASLTPPGSSPGRSLFVGLAIASLILGLGAAGDIALSVWRRRHQ
jgi:hypothetical protein